MIRVELTAEQKQELRRLTRQAVGRVALRAQMVLLNARGYSAPHIGQLLDYDERTVRYWLEKFIAEGGAGLEDDPRTGRPSKMTAEAQASLNTMVAESPFERGLWATVWTVTLLAGQLAPVVGSVLHSDTVRRRLHRLDWRWRKPKHVSPRKDDPEAEAKLAAIRQVVQEVTTDKTEEAPILPAEDESTFSWLPLLRRMWTRRGQQAQVKTPGEPKKVTCFGALNLITGEWLYYFAPHAWAIYFETFLEQLIVAYPGRTIYLIMDNATIHRRAKIIIRWLEQHPQVVPLWLPTYSMELNPVERLWGEIKQRIAANHCHPSIQALQEALSQFFKHGLSREKALQVAGKANPVQWAA
jgi:transposase